MSEKGKISRISSSSPAASLIRSLEPDQRHTAGLLALEMMHEIRNPLEALSHLTFLALEEADNADQVRTYMRMAEEQVRTLTRIASQTLGFARISQNATAIDLVDLAEAALRIHQRTVAAKRIHLVKDLPNSLLADIRSGQMLQVVSNLIVNGLEALPEAGTLRIRVRRAANTIHLLVADNGHGIRAEHCGRLFEPFFTTKETGNGFGLALSKQIVEEHGGTLRFRTSVRDGRSGTAFRISLPCGS